MTENNEFRRRRRTERSQRLYTARDLHPEDEVTLPQQTQQEDKQIPSSDNASLVNAEYAPNDDLQQLTRPQYFADASEFSYDQSGYMPNEEELYAETPADSSDAQPFYDESLYMANQETTQPFDDENQYAPNEETPLPVFDIDPEPEATAVPQVEPADFSAYFMRDDDRIDETGRMPTFAPPIKLGTEQMHAQPDYFEPDESAAQNHVYRPLEATWAQTERRHALSPDGDIGYQVQEDKAQPASKRRAKRIRRTVAILVLLLVLLAAAVYLLRDKIPTWTQELTGVELQTEKPYTPVVTAEPIKGYDASPEITITQRAQLAITEIAAGVDMQSYAITATHAMMRNARPDGMYDFYLFTADEGKLLAYFEGLDANDMIPMENGYAYVKQAPYLLNAHGSTLIRVTEIEKMMGKKLVLSPIQNGWSIISTEDGVSANYIKADGQMLSNLWFARLFPFTAQRTIAYVDTGNTADLETRYLLYVLGNDGSMLKWKSTAEMTEVIDSACDFAYMDSGELFALSDLSEPICVAGTVDAYLDCGAVVAKNSENGKYGLFVDGEQLYDFDYDFIQPVASDIRWAQSAHYGNGGSFTKHAVTEATYPQPLSHYFLLSKDGQEELVALSTKSTYPILLSNEF